jgi:hypothetical protein
MCRRKSGCARIATWREESRVPSFNPVNKRDQFCMFFLEE